LLFLVIAQLAHSSCPDGYDLVRDGECRGFAINEYMSGADVSKLAVEVCDTIDGQPVIVHNDEHQSYWQERAFSLKKGFMILGIVCNKHTSEYEWADGSPIDYKPPAGYSIELDRVCSADIGWTMNQNGSWSFEAQIFTLNAYFYCTTHLVQPVRGGDGCDGFADDDGDGVCYQVSAASDDWEDARVVCKKLGADLASIHSKA
ncbi:hypothetical protein PMAYCL1PPCAC_26268, partial [Pristionchus mayeri]